MGDKHSKMIKPSCFSVQQSELDTHTDEFSSEFPSHSAFDGINVEELEKSQQMNPQPRVCFTSLFYLYNEWRSISHDVLYSSLIILDCSKRCFFMQQTNPSTESTNMDNIVHPMTSTERLLARLNISNDREFIAMIFQKEAQGHLLWVDPSVLPAVKDENTCATNTVDLKWVFISQWLQIHTDPVTGDKYNPIQLSQQWWMKRVERQITSLFNEPKRIARHAVLSEFKFSDNLDGIITEIAQFQNTFNHCCEILHQSNPTLIAMTKWDETSYDRRIDLIEKAYNIVSPPLSSPPLLSSVSSTSQLQLPTLSPKRELANDSISANEANVISERVHFGLEDDDGFVYLY